MRNLTTKFLRDLGSFNIENFERVKKAYQTFLSIVKKKETDIIKTSFTAYMDQDGINMILNGNSTLGEKLSALNSLKKVIGKLGSASKTFESQYILPALKKCMEKRDLRKCALEVLIVYIESVGKELRDSINKIIADILFLILDETDLVVKILEILIIDMRNYFRQYFNQIPSLPNIPSLEKINKVIKEEVRETDTEIEIENKIQSLDYESFEVKINTLTHLCNLLSTNQNKILVLYNSDPIKSSFQILYSKLIFLLTDSNLDIRFLSAKCLGLIGVIAPSRISISSNITIGKELTPFELATTLLRENIYKLILLGDKGNKIKYSGQELINFCNSNRPEPLSTQQEISWM